MTSVLWRYHNRPAEELYDVQQDPNELHNLAADPAYKETLAGFREQVAEWREAQNDHESGPFTPQKHKGGTVAPYIFK